MDIDVKRLKELLVYYPDWGIFTWIKHRGAGVKGYPAGTLNLGYTRIRIDGKAYRAGRLAWLYMTGKWPEYEIDHINNIKNDDRWLNLREADVSTNHMNVGLTAANTSGYKGVYFNKPQGKWMTQIRIDGIKQTIGVYDNLEEAGKAYQEAALRYHKEFARF